MACLYPYLCPCLIKNALAKTLTSVIFHAYSCVIGDLLQLKELLRITCIIHEKLHLFLQVYHLGEQGMKGVQLYCNSLN